MTDKEMIVSSDTQRQNRVPPGQRLTDRWPVLHHGSVPQIDLNHWTFFIRGLVEERTLNYQEFSALPQVQVFSDIHCVTTWSRLNNLWDGISASTVKDLAKPLPEAKFVIVHGSGGFSTNLALEDFAQTDVLFALKHDGEVLSPGHGYPVRLVVPRLYFWKSAKWVTGIEFTAVDRPGFWESNGYHNRGDPWQEERYG
jgi:DMSO/TMAO reductase YedYZ molybdopterin-dependent catalytic subunit